MFDFYKQKTIIIAFIGCLLLLLGNFLPIVSIQSDTIDFARTFQFASYEGRYIVLATILSLILILIQDQKIAIVPNIVSTIILSYLVFNKSALYDDCSFYESMFSWGYGLYFLIIGNILIYVGLISNIFKDKFIIRKKEND